MMQNKKESKKPKTRIEIKENEDLELDEGTEATAGIPETPEKARPSHDGLDYRSGQNLGTPIILVLAAIALIMVTSFLFTYGENGWTDFPTVAERVPSPDVNSQITPDPAPPAKP